MAVAAALTATAAGRPGDSDTSFGTGGRLTVDLGGGDGAGHVLLQPDGRIVLAGGGGSNKDVVLLRRLADGSPDPSFGTGGLVTADFGGDDLGSSAALAPGGKIVVVGTSVVGSASYIVVLRRNADGSQDNTFNGNGRVLLDYGGANDGRAVAVQPDGKIIVAGSANPNGDMAVTRLQVNGLPDPTFDTDGTIGIDFTGTDTAYAALVQPDGKVVVGGRSSFGGYFLLARLTAAGTLDPAFGVGGKNSLYTGTSSQVNALARQPDGKLLFAGASGGNMTVTRLLANGNPDGSFGLAGSMSVDIGGSESGADLALQPDGKIVVAGATSAGTRDMLVARFQPAGVLDTTFGVGGVRTVDFGGNDAATGVALQPDGRILVAGTGGTALDVALARLEGDPQPAGAPGGGTAPGGGASARPGTAIPRCAGRKATIVGTARRDLLRGTARRDVIAGLAGDDVIRGLGGDDVICGGPGADTLLGGAGRDRLLGEAGRDSLNGGAGRDVLGGGAGRDRCAGGAGLDRAVCERSRTL
jgi:uncharacterized delta-60 repeat protein